MNLQLDDIIRADSAELWSRARSLQGLLNPGWFKKQYGPTFTNVGQ